MAPEDNRLLGLSVPALAVCLIPWGRGKTTGNVKSV